MKNRHPVALSSVLRVTPTHQVEEAATVSTTDVRFLRFVTFFADPVAVSIVFARPFVTARLNIGNHCNIENQKLAFKQKFYLGRSPALQNIVPESRLMSIFPGLQLLILSVTKL